jgi:hypothetical protein
MEKDFGTGIKKKFPPKEIIKMTIELTDFYPFKFYFREFQ